MHEAQTIYTYTHIYKYIYVYLSIYIYIYQNQVGLLASMLIRSFMLCIACVISPSVPLTSIPMLNPASMVAWFMLLPKGAGQGEGGTRNGMLWFCKAGRICGGGTLMPKLARPRQPLPNMPAGQAFGKGAPAAAAAAAVCMRKAGGGQLGGRGVGRHAADFGFASTFANQAFPLSPKGLPSFSAAYLS